MREKGREGERDEEKHQCVVASRVPPTGNLAHNPGMCPDWESNWRPFFFFFLIFIVIHQRPFSSQAHTLSTELLQPELMKPTLKCWNLNSVLSKHTGLVPQPLKIAVPKLFGTKDRFFHG